MIPRECKRLAEVDFPIATVSRHAVREKSIRHGHPSTLHLWWARRPLASSRAILLALLLPDPCDPHCPETFKAAARELFGDIRSELDVDLRRRLLNFIAAFANWDNSANSAYLEAGRALVKAAHGEEPPLVVDPFAGGGSIPLEALRLGCQAFASDLNPVACLILKVMLEDIPRHGPDIADELRKAGMKLKRQAERELADLYPIDPDGATPIAYLWARTVRCESPTCGAEIPLMRSFWLCKKAKRKKALRHVVERVEGSPPKVGFEVFEPKTERDVHGGTVTRAKATCLCCSAVLPPERVRLQLAAERGGTDVKFDTERNRVGGALMIAVVTLRPNEKGRHYRLPTDNDYAAVQKAQLRVSNLLNDWERAGKPGLCPIPNEPISLNEIRRISLPIYGMKTWGDLFTARQKATLAELGQRTAECAPSLRLLMAIVLNRTADGSASLSSWLSSGEEIKHVFARQALPIVWDFGEANYLASASRTWASALASVANVLEKNLWHTRSGDSQRADAATHPLPNQSAAIWFTDPPYYDAVPYAHLSDFFYVWMKRVLPNDSLLHELDDHLRGNATTPKDQEIVVDRPHRLSNSKKNSDFYETTLGRAFAEGRRVLDDNGIGSVVFAHKTTEGWEALLSGIILGGWTITGSWPVATEMTSRLNARETASLATSVHLICRPRPKDASIGEWAEVLQELPLRVSDWMEHLQGEGVRGADLVFACIGPALEVFSRYRAVETAEGREVRLPEYLEKVWEVVGRTALEQILGTAEASARNGMIGALEEDARLTALFLWALQNTEDNGPMSQIRIREPNELGRATIRDAPAPTDTNEKQEEDIAKATARGFHLPFDVVRRFSQPMGIDLDRWTGRVVAQEKGVVRLLPVSERAKILFGAEGVESAADWIEIDENSGGQATLFPELDPESYRSAGGPASGAQISVDTVLESPETTALDRVHAAMLLQAGGHANALRALIMKEQERAPDFLRLSNALSALYPRGSREKRLLDAMLLAVPR